MTVERKINSVPYQGNYSLEPYITTIEAARVTGFSESTLKLSRHTGILAGVKSPCFFKVGRSVRYKKSDLMTWMGQFGKYSNTVQKITN